ncbi:App1 family protein [Stomatohabitans albus]|uniref:App1 family protein n=1 Tax=Stomatohabitans albus TaxID=3110766 RepID=UPI00300D6B92
MSTVHYAYRIATHLNQRLTQRLRQQGWVPHPQVYPGLGDGEKVQVMGRVLLGRMDDRHIWHQESTDVEVPKHARGWRQFITAPMANAAIEIQVGKRTLRTRTDRDGYFDLMVHGHGLVPGWHTVRVRTTADISGAARIYILNPKSRVGLLSDIDDTVIITHLPRPFIAAYNAFVLTEEARDVVPGMGTWYRQILQDHPFAPVVYLSTGAFNTVPFLQRFLHHHQFPSGMMLMTDWGTTTTGWFRSGLDHKRKSLARLVKDFPQIKWILVGDDGQHDAMVYNEFARQHPDHVAMIGIRELTPVEHALIHGQPVPPGGANVRNQPPIIATSNDAVPTIHGPDGYALAAAYRHWRNDSRCPQPGDPSSES